MPYSTPVSELISELVPAFPLTLRTGVHRTVTRSVAMRAMLVMLSGMLLASVLSSCIGRERAGDAVLPVIEWDSGSMRRISEQGDPFYNGYARLIRLDDGSLFAVYFNSGNGIMKSRSYDGGDTWTSPSVVLPNSRTHRMDNPEIVQLSDEALLISTNLRPMLVERNQDPTRRFQIGVIRSDDLGESWSDLKIVYTASWRFTEGCWEPKAIQWPSGEIQLYFSDEAPYTKSGEQNISMLSSGDGGQTWTTEPVVVSFRRSFRDGMATPLILSGSDEIVIPIEDNGYAWPYTHKIAIIRGRTTDGWQKPVSGNSPNREYALRSILPRSGPYAGAPYITQLPSGETVLSYQSTTGRASGSDNVLDNAIPYAVVGDAEARHFQNVSIPFDIPEGKSGLWNSVAALDDGEIALLTSTNGLSHDGRNEVWMIKGLLRH